MAADSYAPTYVTDELTTDYPHATWRLLITPPTDGATNMAIDEAILDARAEGDSTPTLRFFQWQPPTLSLGYNQHWEEANLAALESLGYGWTRRPTGGKAILHTDELTYSLIVPQADPRIEGGIMRSYQRLSLGLLRGLHKLGLPDATQASRDDIVAKRKKSKGGPVCFDTPSRYEITWQGKKLIGSAQLRRRQIVLQHGTLPLHGDLNRILDVLAFSPEERAVQEELLPDRAITLEHALGRVVSFEEAMQAISAGFAEQLNLSLEIQPLTPREEELVAHLRAEQYANDAWNKRV